MFDKNLMYKHIPNFRFNYERQEFKQAIKFNSNGLRDYEYSYEKDANSYRILVIGDSVPEALQVSLDKSFTKILERKLNQKSQKKYEVINAGTGGYGTENELIFLKKEGINYRPNAIILVFSPNDIEDNYASLLIDVVDGKIKENIPISVSVPKRLMLYCSRYLDICSLFQSTVLIIKKKDNSDKNLFKYYPYSKENSREFKKAMDDTLFLINKMSNFAEQNKINFVIVVAPSREQVDDKMWQKYMNENGLNEDTAEYDKLQRYLMSDAKSKNINIIDLLPAFKQKNINNTFYYNIDGHWNQKGHELAADLLYDYLKNNKLVI